MDAEPVRLKANAGALNGHGIWGDLPEVAPPTVIIGASADKLHGLDEVNLMAQRMPNAFVEVMESNKETHSGKAGSFIAKAMGGDHEPQPAE